MPEAPAGRPRTHGVRFFVTDAVFLGALGVLGIALREPLGPLLGVIPFAAGHFFLFCNVFRVRRRLELAWTAVALANLGWWLGIAQAVDWWAVLAVQTPVTLGVLGLELRSPRYHGVGARRINAAHLDAYLDGTLG